MNKEDGGPAFPDGTGAVLRENGMLSEIQGMSLRDYFAAKVAAAFCAGPDGGLNPAHGTGEDWKQFTARTAYEVADAMLDARTA